MDVTPLRSLATVAQLHTVRAAAERLGFTPAAVSQHLSTLSARTGAPVVEANGRGIRLTPFGNALLEQADPLLRADESFTRWLRGEDRRRRTHLRIGYFASAGKLWIPHVIETLRQAAVAETFELVVTERDPQLARGVDVNVYVDGPGRAVDLGRDALLTSEPYVVAVPTGHRLASSDHVHLAALAHEDWIDNDIASGHCRQIFLTACASVGFAPRFTVETQDYETALAFVALGLGITAMPAALVGMRVPTLLLTDPTPIRHVHVGWRNESPAATAAANVLQRLLREGG